MKARVPILFNLSQVTYFWEVSDRREVEIGQDGQNIIRPGYK